MRTRTLVSAALAVSLAPGPLSAQRKAPPPVFGTEVALVLLPVFVIDRKGHAVRGLGPADFEVQENGIRGEIVSFRYVDTSAREEQQEIRLASAARRRFLLLFDKSFTDPAGLNRAQRAAEDFVRSKLAASDLAAVATFDIYNGVRLVANFSEDRSLLAHAVRTLGVPSLTRISDPLALVSELGVADVTREQAGIENPGAALDDVVRALAQRARSAEDEEYRAQILRLIDSFERLAAALRHVDGRKQVLYFSAGFDSRLLTGQKVNEARDSSRAVSEGRLWEASATPRYGDSRVRDVLAAMVRSLTRADAVLHAVDVTGLGQDRSLTQTSVTQDPHREHQGRETLAYLAAETGGRLFKDANDLGPALDEMLEMTSRYYVLGIQPAKAVAPGAFHKLRVRVSRKDVTVSHRAGYYERETAAARTVLRRQFEAAQLVLAGGARDELPFSALCLPFPRDAEQQALGLVVQVPRSSLRWEAGRSASQLEVYGYLVAADGSVRDHIGKHARLDLQQLDPDGRAGGVSLFGTLAVPPGQYTLRLLVRDAESGASGLRLLDITVPPYDHRVGFLLPPVVMDDVKSWVVLEAGRGRDGEPRPPFPFQVAGQPFLPRASSEVSSGRAERLVLFAYEPQEPGDPAADLHIRASLRDGAGRTLSPGSVRIERMDRAASGLRTYVLSYTPEALPAGDYTLRVGVGEGGALLESYALIRLRPSS